MRFFFFILSTSPFLLSVREGNLEVLRRGCVFRVLEAPKVQEWHHVCLVLSPDFGFYFDGKIVRGITECKLGSVGPLDDGTDGYGDDAISDFVDDGDVSEVTNGVEVVLGGSNWNALPFSGFLADVRVFSRNLSSGEVASVAALDDASPPYFSVGVNLPGSRLALSGVEVSEIEAEKLLEAPEPRKYLYFAEKTTYATASDACAKLGGEFLTYSKTGREDLAKNVSDYMDQVPVDVGYFWVQVAGRTTNGDACPSARVGKATQTLSLDYIPCGVAAAAILCQVPEDFRLKVLGLDDDNAFSPSYDAPGMFASRTKHLLSYTNGQLTLRNVLSGEVIYERHLGSIEHLLGRPLLQEDEEGGPRRTLVVSSCREDQFTCSCGSCVSLDDACNLSLECPDGSDEIYCSHKCEVPWNYKKEFSPSMGSRLRTEVGLEVVLENVEPMINQNLLQLTLNITAVWRDSRLNFSFLEVDRPVRLTEEVFSDLWLPRIALDTAVEEDKGVFNFRDSPGVFSATAQEAGVGAVVGDHEGEALGVRFRVRVMPFSADAFIGI